MNSHHCKVCNRYFTRRSYLESHFQSKCHQTRILKKDELFICHCAKTFLSESGLRRHKNKCKVETHTASFYEKKLEDKDKKLEEQRKQIEELLKNGSNITNIQNQVNINYYGCENLEYITQKFIEEMTKVPYNSIQNIIKHIHFHPAHPENHNVKITNRKLQYASVYKNNKWELTQKNQTIDELMQKSYGIMNDQVVSLDHLTDKRKERYEAFQEKFEQDDPEALKKIYKDVELCLLNGTL